jgi:hypothetical protein
MFHVAGPIARRSADCRVANDFEPDAIARQRLQVALLGIAPPVPAFLLLRSRRARPVGIAYATAGGLVGAIVLALPAGLMLRLIETSDARVRRTPPQASRRGDST